MKDAGIIDPAKVTRTALENAASVAGTILLTEAVVVDKQEVGIKNCVELGLSIKNFTYTLGSLDQLNFVLEETRR